MENRVRNPVVHLFSILSLLVVQSTALFYGYDKPGDAINNHNEVPEFATRPIKDNRLVEFSHLTEEVNWPHDKTLDRLGQVSGIAAGHADIVYVFHRGDVVFDVNAFDGNNMYRQTGQGPISNQTVLVLNGTTGQIIRTWGSDRFYMPHGISLDPEGNVWVTDVALHQVFRFKRGIWDKPDLILGQAFLPGNDYAHFCKPTDVAVSSSGIIYISDGYCNSRIVIVSPDGQFIGEIGTAEKMVIPHSLTLLETEDLICAADREKRRILCYNAGLTPKRPGDLVFEIRHPKLGRVYAIDHIGDMLLAVSSNGANALNKFSGSGITLDLATEELVQIWGPKNGFNTPHDISACPTGQSVYVCDVSPSVQKKIYKFRT